MSIINKLITLKLILGIFNSSNKLVVTIFVVKK